MRFQWSAPWNPPAAFGQYAKELESTGRRRSDLGMVGSEIVTRQVHIGASFDRQCEVKIRIGRLVDNGREFKDTFLLEIDTPAMFETLKQGFPSGFHLVRDIAHTLCVRGALEVAAEFLKERGLIVCRYICGMPEMSMLVCKAGPPSLDSALPPHPGRRRESMEHDGDLPPRRSRRKSK